MAGMTRIQEQAHILDVVFYRRLHPFCWEGHDYKCTQKIENLNIKKNVLLSSENVKYIFKRFFLFQPLPDLMQ